MLQYDDSCVVGGRGKVGDVAFWSDWTALAEAPTPMISGVA